MLARFRAAHEKLASEELLVMQLRDGSLRLRHSQHLDEGKTLRALIVFVSHDLRVLHLAYAVEKFKEVAFGGLERQVADVKTGCGDFDCFRLARIPRRLADPRRLAIA